MKIAIITGLISISLLLTSCGSRNGSESASASPARTRADAPPASEEVQAAPAPAQAAPSASLPVTQSVLAVWQEGDKAEAVRRFVAADWSARPTFATGMALNLSEDQFKALPEADRELKAKEMMTQLDLIKQLAEAVALSGQAAAANGDAAQARKCFTSLKQFGTALEGSDHLRLVQLVGQVSQKMADNELAKAGK